MNLVVFAWGMVSGGAKVSHGREVVNRGNPYSAYPQLNLVSEVISDAALVGDVEKANTGNGVDVNSPQPSMEPVFQKKETVESDALARPDKKLCELVGPFESKNIANDFIERLLAIEVKSSLQELELPAGPGYWVYLTPRDTRREAFRMLNELQAKRIDSYVIPKGDLANGISLGMFSKKSLADARMREMKAIGLDPEVEEIERTYRELWVMLNEAEGLKMSDLSWERAMDGINLLQRRQNYCLSVASE